MNRCELLTKAIAAMRSGEFRQCRDDLRDGNAFCAVGLICEVYRRETGRGEWDGHCFVLGDNRNHGTLDADTREALGLTKQETNVIEMHNDAGVSLSVIADYVEKKLLQENATCEM